MDNGTTGKELVLTSEQLEPKRSKPTLIKVGKRDLCTTGKFHPELGMDYAIERRQRWIPVPELARVFFGAATIDGKKRVRKQFPQMFMQGLRRGEFLLKELSGEGRRRIQAVKVLDVSSEQERQAAADQLTEMRARRELTAGKYERALQVIELQENVKRLM